MDGNFRSDFRRNPRILQADGYTTLAIALELSGKSWELGAVVPGVTRRPRRRLDPRDIAGLLKQLEHWKAEATKAGRPDDRSLLQKLSDLLPSGPVKLASLTPDSGLLRQAPDLSALGYDKLTAVYDISARIVYLPDGTILEAHSGMGKLRDDPEHVSEHMVGATAESTHRRQCLARPVV